MGLEVSTHFLVQMKNEDEEGYEYYKNQYSQIREVLAENGLSDWEEPEEELGDKRSHIAGFSYGFLEFLRRAFTYADTPGSQIFPVDELSEDDENIIEMASMMFTSHLLCHSSVGGFYVPVEFDEPIFDLDKKRVGEGDILGSSFSLLKELRQIAPHLEIKLTNTGELSDEEAARLFATKDGEPFWREKIVFLALWENVTASIEHGSALVFH